MSASASAVGVIAVGGQAGAPAGFNQHVYFRLLALQQRLLAGYIGGQRLPSPVMGLERELFVKDFLQEIFPPIYRFGSGVITDIAGSVSGQLDVVVEIPLAPSYPSPGDGPRVYLADSVAIALEVKSNLDKKKDIVDTSASVKNLNRIPNLTSAILTEDSGVPQIEPGRNVPFYAIGFKGPQSASAAHKYLSTIDEKNRPDGIFVIESGAFKGVRYAGSGLRGYNLFIGELSEHLNGMMQIGFPNVAGYSSAYTVTDSSDD